MKSLLIPFVFSLAFTCLAESEVVDGVTWHYTPWKNGVAVRRDPTHVFDTKDYDVRFRWEFGRADLEIPSRLGGRPVLRIENDTFADGLMSIHSITIPSTVEEIGDRAFIQCYGLTYISIPRGVRKIGFEAFRNCYQVRKLVLPSTVTEIGVGAFNGMVKLNSVVAPASIQERFPNIFPQSPDVKWRRSRTPCVVGVLVLLALLVFRKPLFHAIKKKGTPRMINRTHVCALVLGLAFAPVSQSSPYYTTVTNEWWQGRQTNVLAMAESRLAANTNDIAGLLMKASYDFDFADSPTLSNSLVRVLSAGTLVTTPAFTNAFRLASLDIQWTFKTLSSETPAEHASDMIKVMGPGHPMAYSDELKALDDDGYFNESH